MAKLFANSGEPDQTMHSAVSDLGLHCLPSTLLRVSRLQRVNYLLTAFNKSFMKTSDINHALDRSAIDCGSELLFFCILSIVVTFMDAAISLS